MTIEEQARALAVAIANEPDMFSDVEATVKGIASALRARERGENHPQKSASFA